MSWLDESIGAVKHNAGRKTTALGSSTTDAIISQRLRENRFQKRQPRSMPVLPQNINRFYDETLMIERKKALLKQVRDSARSRAREEMKGFKGYVPPRKRGLLGDLPN
jgi:hypothetical protein